MWFKSQRDHSKPRFHSEIAAFVYVGGCAGESQKSYTARNVLKSCAGSMPLLVVARAFDSIFNAYTEVMKSWKHLK